MIITKYDYLYIGSAPADEDCCQVGRDSVEKQNDEAVRFMKGLARYYKERLDQFPGEIYFQLKRESHDFGDYWDVIVQYDGENEAVFKLASEIENGSPLTWAELEGAND